MKKAAITTLQIAVTLGILFFVFRDPAKRAEMAAALRGANSWWLFLGVAVYGLAEIVACIRWQTLLRVQGIVLGWRRVFSLTMIGLFFSFLIPGDTGGDVVKLFYLLKETAGQRTAAVLSVLVDRLIGLIALIVLAASLTFAHWTWLTGTPQTAQYVWIVFFILGVGIAGLVFSLIVTGFGLVYRLPARMPGRERLAELALAYNLYARAWKPSFAAFILSFGVHLLHMATFYCAALAFSSPGARTPTPGEFFSIAPIINTIVSLPISLGGIGVRESLFEIFLGNLCGVSQAIAVIISSTGYILTLFWGLVGAAIYLAYRPSEHARLREMRQEVAAAEHTAAELELAREAQEHP
ncbi:MAG: lysylphosphatidylglycerol synthase transmembrane domain-containing protein [Chthoniobacteraceae bacterium]